MKQELETLRAELHSIVDAKINKLINPMSLEELCNTLKFCNGSFIGDYLRNNKTQIIETLNNL